MACHNPHRLRHHMPLQVATQAGRPAGVPAAVLKRFPHLAGCTALLIPDNVLHQVDLVRAPDAPPALSLLGAFGCNPSTATLTGSRTRLSHGKPCRADALVEFCMLTSHGRGVQVIPIGNSLSAGLAQAHMLLRAQLAVSVHEADGAPVDATGAPHRCAGPSQLACCETECMNCGTLLLIGRSIDSRALAYWRDMSSVK